MNYEKLYRLLIAKRVGNPPVGYSEKHHIVPRSMGGGNDCANIVRLTAREHFIAHRLLAKMHGGVMWYALACMSRVNTKSAKGVLVSSRLYDLIKREDAKHRSKAMTVNNHFRGKKHTRETTERMRGPRPNVTGENHHSYGKKYPQRGEIISYVKKYIPNETKIDSSVADRIHKMLGMANSELAELNTFYRKSIAASKRQLGIDNTGSKNPNWGNGQAISGSKNPIYGTKRSAETRAKIGAKAKRTLSCPHCGKVANIANAHRWHFDNCKSSNKTKAA